MTDDPRAQYLSMANALRVLIPQLENDRMVPFTVVPTQMLRDVIDLLAVVPPPPQEPKKEKDHTRVDEWTVSPLPVTTAPNNGATPAMLVRAEE